MLLENDDEDCDAGNGKRGKMWEEDEVVLLSSYCAVVDVAGK
jgi:hypothetical protein